MAVKGKEDRVPVFNAIYKLRQLGKQPLVARAQGRLELYADLTG